MNGYYSEYDGEYDTGEFYADQDEADYEGLEEAKRPKRPAKPVRTAPRGSTYRPPVPGNIPQLQNQVNRLEQKLGINSNAIKIVDGRSRAANMELNRLNSVLRKEAMERKKESEALRNSLQTVAIAPLLFPPDSPLAGIGPLLLLGDGLGGGSSSNSPGGLFGGGGGGGTGLLALLALSGSLGQKQNSPTK